MPIGGALVECDNAIKGPMGVDLRRNSDNFGGGGIYSRLDYFFMMFPPEELSFITRLTSARLAEENKALTSTGEVILITKFEFGSRRSLW